MSGESGSEEAISQGSKGSRVSKSDLKKLKSEIGDQMQGMREEMGDQMQGMREEMAIRFQSFENMMAEQIRQLTDKFSMRVQEQRGGAEVLYQSAAERFPATTGEGERSVESNIRGEENDEELAAAGLHNREGVSSTMFVEEQLLREEQNGSDGGFRKSSKEKEKQRRRESTVHTIYGGPAYEGQLLTHVVNKKEFEHILKSIDVKSVVWHMSQLRRYEADGQCYINLATTIEEKAKSVLLSLFLDKKKKYKQIKEKAKPQKAIELDAWLRKVEDIQEVGDFYKLTREELDEIIRLCVKPVSAFHFLENCKRVWKFRAPDNFIPGPMNWSITLSCTLEYLTLVRKTYDMQAFHGSNKFYEGELIPRVDSGRANDTLAGVFLDNLPKDWANFIGRMVYKGKHKEFPEYLVDVTDVVHGVNRNVQENVKPWFIIWASSQERQAQGKLMNVSQAMVSGLDGEEEFSNGDPPVASQELFDAAVADKVEKKMFEELSDFYAMGLPTMATSRSNMKATPDFDPKKFPCTLKAQFGECKKEGCKYSHDEAFCRAKAKEMHKAWSKSPYLAAMEHGEEDA